VVAKKTEKKATALGDVEETLLGIRQKFGDTALMRLGERVLEKVPVIPTGSYALDRALGIGGYPRGRIVEIYGPEASGKTTLTLHAMANVQRLGGRVAFIDVEHALDPAYAESVGVNTDELLLSQPDFGEQALDITYELINSGIVQLVVFDSVAALVPKVELEGNSGDAHMGLQARLMGQAMRRLTPCAQRNGVCLIFINQIRHKIGVLFGSPETTTGGNALKYFASVRLDVRKRDKINDGDETIGNLTEVKVVKNKFYPPFKRASFDIIYGKGIDHYGDLINVAVQVGVLSKSGTWYIYDTERLGQGRKKVEERLRADIDVYKKIRDAVEAACRS